MGYGIQEGKETSEGDIGLQRKDTEEVRGYGKGEKAKPGRRQKERPVGIVDADQIKITVGHFFKDYLNGWMDEVHEPRELELHNRVQGREHTKPLCGGCQNQEFASEKFSFSSELVNKGGRQRWKIENQGFKDQKRHDFELEHLSGEHPNAWNLPEKIQIRFSSA